MAGDPVNKSDPTGLQEAPSDTERRTRRVEVHPAALPAIKMWNDGVTVWNLYSAVTSLGMKATADAIDPDREGVAEPSRPSDGLPVQDGAVVVKPGKTGSVDQIWEKGGGAEGANDDFDNSPVLPDSVKDIKNGGRTGVLEDGRKITVRPNGGTTDPRPTVEVTSGNGRGRDTDKFRYND